MQTAASAALTPLSGEGVEPAESATTARGRAVQARLLAGEADRLRWAVGVLGECEAGVPGEALRAGDRGEFVRHFAADEIACTLGLSLTAARDLLWLAERLATVMPCALEALGQARLDVGRVRVLAEATSVLDDATAAAVATELVTALDAPVWEGPSPRAWRARVQRAVVRADATDITVVDQVLTDLAHARAGVDPATGQATTLDQRRADALVEVFRSVRTGAALPAAPVRRVHDLGLVLHANTLHANTLHADTLHADGPHATATGQLRGLGAPTPLDAASARQLAHRQLAAGTAVQVLVVDPTGALAHVVRLTDATTACRSRADLLTAVRAALAHPPPAHTDRYRPTTAITRHVSAEAPTCSHYDCPRPTRSCNLDHDDPWPRGPTANTNLDPKCRHHHQTKTLALVRTHLSTGPGQGPRHTTWTLRTGATGATVTTHPEPLPGCEGPGPRANRTA